MSRATAINAEAFQKQVLDWYRSHGRKTLPWQENPSPYRVWVSEIMLQQTQVQTVIPYFQRWMDRFESVQALAEASLDQVMTIWQGLGYYSRARNLHRGAQCIVQECGGLFPDTADDLQRIPGVGRYTAGAIMAFAYDRPAPLVDGNIKRLFCRLFGIEGHPSQSAVNRRLWNHAESLVPVQQNRAYAQGLLDLGATVCAPVNPACSACPLQTSCVAMATDRIGQLPTARPARTKPVRDGRFLWAETNGRLLLEKRDRSVWQGLWCLPEISLDTSSPEQNIAGTFKHQFTHYQLNATVIQDYPLEIADHWRWTPLGELDQLGLPTPIRRFIQQQTDTIVA